MFQKITLNYIGFILPIFLCSGNPKNEIFYTLDENMNEMFLIKILG